MAELIDVPSRFRCYSKGFIQKLVAPFHVLYNIVVSRTRLVVRYLSSIYELEPALLYQILDYFVHFRRLLVPPHFEEHYFGLGKLLLDILLQDVEDCSKYILYIILIVLLHGHPPASIQM